VILTFHQSQILFAAFRLAIVLLEPGATFVAKMFRGENASFTFSQFYTFFGEVYCGKPSSSRVSSFEAFVVCKNFQ
jgi:tRNA (cytidine32/guanosine34-2'-O)-methyltransferase